MVYSGIAPHLEPATQFLEPIRGKLVIKDQMNNENFIKKQFQACSHLTPFKIKSFGRRESHTRIRITVNNESGSRFQFTFHQRPAKTL